MLCSECEPLCRDLLASTTGVRRLRNYSNLCLSARSCSFCRLLHASLIRNLPPKTPPKIVFPSPAIGSLPLEAFIRFSEGRPSVTWLDLASRIHEHNRRKFLANRQLAHGRTDRAVHQTSSSPKCPEGDTIGRRELEKQRRRRLERRPKSLDDLFRSLKDWIAEGCLRRTEELAQDHFAFRSSKLGFPSRLIDAGTGDNVLEENLRLVWNAWDRLPDNEDEPTVVTASYMTLSHRWSTANTFKTTRENLASRNQGFCLSELPPIFRDAVISARRLKIRFLWIDAMCIVQNEGGNWHDESAKMGDIYRNALCTVAVHCDPNASSGFLTKDLLRKKSYQQHLQVTAGRSVFQGQENTLSLAEQSNQATAGVNGTSLSPEVASRFFDTIERNKFQQEVNNSLLSRRGWILQERLLSQRTIHIVPVGFYLEDDLGVMDDSFSYIITDNYDRAFNGRTVDDANLVARNRHAESRPFIPTHDISLLGSPISWFDIVERYSRCSLTFAEDKLIAIAGVARRIHEFSRVSYYAGIFADHLAYGLLWRRDDTKLRYPATERASSWTWASVDGAVKFLTDAAISSTSSAIQLVDDEDAERLPEWLQGQAKLTISCRVARARVGRSHAVEDQSTNKARSLLGEEWPPNPKLAPTHSTAQQLFGEVGWCILDDDSDHTRTQELSCAVLVVSDIQKLADQRIFPSTRIAYVLLLAKTATHNQYRRVGMGKIDSKNSVIWSYSEKRQISII